jgi:3-oxoacid CoA-transferase A subunit
LDKSFPSTMDAIADIKDGATIAIGGFFSAGVPRHLLQALIKKGVKNLTLACGTGPLRGAVEELNQLVKNRQLKKVIDSYALARSMSKGLEDPFEIAVRNKEIELEIYPMGTLAEKFRAAGAGVPAFYIPTGCGTVVAEQNITNIPENQKTPKETRVIDGRTCILEYALPVDFAFVHAHTGDKEGNLRFRKTAVNFNPVMAKAAKISIAEVEKLVETGELQPDDVHMPGVYIKRIVQVSRIQLNVGID